MEDFIETVETLNKEKTKKIVMTPNEGMAALIKNAKKNTRTFADAVDIVLNTDRQIFIDDVTEDTGDACDTSIRFWNMLDEENGVPVEERKPIKIYINSFGGSLLAAFTCVDSMKMSKTPVWTICTGAAYSAGFLIYICGHKRFCYPRSSFLFHEGSTGSFGDASKFLNGADFYKVQLKQLKDIVIENTKITEEKYKEVQKDDYWMTAEEALSEGVTDIITEVLI